MGGDRSRSTELKEGWGDDTIYSESFCPSEDVFYEGSEDEDYENPAARRCRYEEAGQRFLDGAVPVLISAALRGPFDRHSGFINPWISHRRKETARSLSQTSRPIEKAASQSMNSVRKPEPNPTLQTRYADCHLPSPESLKQAPYTQEHPYLEADEIEKVHQWREQVDHFPGKRNGLLVSVDADFSTSIKKRRAPGSEWLKKVSAKRHQSATTQRRPHRQEQEDDEPDELMADLPSSSFENVTPVMSPSKRRSPRNAMRTTSCKIPVESDDELSPNKAAAATLSSPVSLRNGPVTSSPLKRNQSQNYIMSSIGTQTTPSHLRHVKVLDTTTENRSPSQEEQSDEEPKVKPRAANEQEIEVMVEDTSETGPVSESELEMIPSEDDNDPARLVKDPCTIVSTTDGATLEATNDQLEQQRCGSESPPRKTNAEVDGDPGLIAQRTESDVKIHDVPSIKPEPQGVTECAIQGSVQASTCPDNNGNSDDPPANELCTLVAQPHSDKVVNIESVDEGAARQGGAAELEDKHSDMDSEDDSGNSSVTTQEAPSIGTIEASHSQDTNDASASDGTADDDGEMASMQSESSKMSTTNDHVQQESESGKLETLATPLQAEGVKDVSEFSLRTIFNRFVPSSPWNKLAQLALSPSLSPPAGISEKHAIKEEYADQIQETDDQPSQTTKEEPSPRRNELMSKFSQSHQPVQVQQKVSYSQSDNRLKDSEMEDRRVSESQQSPWANTEQAILPRSRLGILSPNLSGAKLFSIGAENTSTTVFTSDVSNPWAQNTSPDVASLILSSANNENVKQPSFVKPSMPRPRTPEPQFHVKSFSSFMSPSPDQNRAESVSLSASRRLFRSTSGSLPPCLKSRWSQKRPGLRVSWAACLEAFEGTSSRGDFCAATARHMPKRQNSPPPETLVVDFRQAHDTRFAKHFEAVASRKDGQSQSLIPTESQQLQSPGPFAMAETFMTADTNNPGLVSKSIENAENAERLVCSRASEEPMDVVEDMVREMGDFWDPWNIDTELEQARKGAAGETASIMEM